MKFWLIVFLAGLAGWTLAGAANTNLSGVDIAPVGAAVFAAGGALIALVIGAGGPGGHSVR